MEETPGERLKKFRKSLKMTQTELGQIINRSKAVISAYEKGETKIDPNVMLVLKSEFNLNPEWIKNSTSPMYLPGENTPMTDVVPIPMIDINGAYLREFLDGEGVIRHIHMPAIMFASSQENTAGLVAFTIPDDSMEPDFVQGDLVIADTTFPHDPQVACLFALDGALMTGRLSFSDEHVVITFANRPPKLAQMEQVKLMGVITRRVSFL